MDSSCRPPLAGAGIHAKIWLQLAGTGLLLASSGVEARADSSSGQAPSPIDVPREQLNTVADDSSWRVSSYSAPQFCPKEADFVIEVLARSSLTNRSSALTILHASSVSIQVDEKGTRGTLVLPSGELRNVVGTSCSEVAQALALVVALQAKEDPAAPRHTLENTSNTSTAVVEAPGPSPKATILAKAPGAPELSTLPVYLPAIAPASASSVHVRARTVRVLARSGDPGARWAFGIGAVETFGPAPMGLLGGSVFFDYWQHARLPYGLVIALEGTAKATHTIEQASAEFQFWASRFDTCLNPISWKRLSLWLCAEGLLGLTTVAGQQGGPITRERAALQGWYSMGPALRVGWALPDRVRIELTASLTTPFVRHITKFSDPDITAHETGPVAGSLSLRIGYQAGGSNVTRAAISQ